MKASDIKDEEVVTIVDRIEKESGHRVAWYRVAEVLPFPEKVVLAKMRKLVSRKILTADCTCGCFGGYQVA